MTTGHKLWHGLFFRKKGGRKTHGLVTLPPAYGKKIPKAWAILPLVMEYQTIGFKRFRTMVYCPVIIAFFFSLACLIVALKWSL